VSESRRVKVRTLPASTVACTIHNGPFTTIGEAYNAIGKWITDNGYRITGPCREVYLQSVEERQSDRPRNGDGDPVPGGEGVKSISLNQQRDESSSRC
jgi:predicted transcriptional regulator YdeE